MPQLDATWFPSQLFWLCITFVAMYFILSRLVLPPLQDILVRRQQTMTNDVEQAQMLKTQAEHARKDYELMLADARERAQKLFTDALANNKTQAEQAGRDMDRQIEQKLGEATKKINAKKHELIHALAPSTSELTSLIVQKLTQREPDQDSVHSVISSLSKSGGEG